MTPHLSLEFNIEGRWVAALLDEDTSLSIEMENPLFNTEAAGSFSYPFTLNVEKNAHIFPTVESMRGKRIYKTIDKAPFRLYLDGLIMLEGIVNLEDEIEVEEEEEGKLLEIFLVSGNKELLDMVEGINANEVPVKDRIPVGTEFRKIEAVKGDADIVVHMETALPPEVFTLNRYYENLDGTGELVNPTNVSKPYPFPYCNVMVAAQAREKKDGQYRTIREYEIFDADRPNSGVCFYILYFLDCLFAMLHITYDGQRLLDIEDMKRLAFFTTKCHCDAVPTAQKYTSTTKRFEAFMELFDELKVEWGRMLKVNEMAVTAWRKYANGKNFPEVEVKNILQDIQNAFGIRFIYHSDMKKCEAVLVEDVMKQKQVERSGALVRAAVKKEYRVKGVKMTYGDSEDTMYNYDPADSGSRVVMKKDYREIVNKKGSRDKNTYYSKQTGNMYRIKVDEDANTEKELYPSLMEVGAFADAWMGDISDTDAIKEIAIGFKPVINNIIEYIKTNEGVVTTGLKSAITSSSKTQKEAASKCPVFLDIELEEPETYTIKEVKNAEGFIAYNENFDFWVEYKARFGFTQAYAEATRKYNYNSDLAWAQSWRTEGLPNAPLARFTESPINAYDAGYCIGIMRGAGSGGGADIVNENYDGNGNAKWAYTPKGYAFTADSINHEGMTYDYDSGIGGADLSQRISLKLRAEKVKSFLDRVTEDGTAEVGTVEEAAYWLGYLFSSENVNPMELRVVKTASLTAMGYNFPQMGEYAAVAPVLIGTRLMNAITVDGIWDKRNLTLYVQNHTTSTGSLNDVLNICIKENATDKDVEDIIGLTNVYYFYENFPSYTLTGMKDSSATDFYPIAKEYAGRGLMDKLNNAYFWFLMNAKVVTLKLKMEAAEARDINLMAWHTYGEYTGLIKSVSYNADNQQGLSNTTIELYYL